MSDKHILYFSLNLETPQTTKQTFILKMMMNVGESLMNFSLAAVQRTKKEFYLM